MKSKQPKMRRWLWPWLLTLFAFSINAQTFKDGMQEGVLRIKVKPELMMASPQGLKTRVMNDVAVTGIQALDKLSEQYDVKSIERVFRYSPKHEAKHQKYGLHLWYTVTFNATASPIQLANAYSKLMEVESAEPVFEKNIIPYSITEMLPRANKSVANMPFNDTYLDRQWHYHNTGQNGGTPGSDINLFEAWKKVTGSKNVIVSVHDNGMDITHEDIAANLWINEAELNGKKNIDDDGNGYRDDIHGFNFADNSSVISKGDHGTHVGGTISAVNNNGIGVAGIAGGTGNNDGAKIMVCQILGGSWTDLIAESFVYAADNGAVISQNSWGYQNPYSYEQVVHDAIDYFIAEAGNYSGSPMKGGVVIFASGNSATNLPMYPGYYKSVIAVSAIGPRFEVAPYSNYGDWIDISAPGGNGDWGVESSVLSTIPNNKYGYMDGTSMACPHVSGVAALIVARNGGEGYTNTMLKTALLTGINEKIYHQESNAGFEGMLGAGMTDALLAIARDDKHAPDAINDLQVKGIAQDFASLTWSVPSDEDDGQPITFEIFYSKHKINSSNISSASSVKIKNSAKTGATAEYEIEGLEPVTEYFFYVRSYDRWGNVSELSNEISGTTNKGPKIETDKTTLSSTIDVTTASQSSITFNISNLDEGLLKWNGEVRHVSSTDYLRSSYNYPKAVVSSAKTELGILNISEKSDEKPSVTPYAQEQSQRSFRYFDMYAGFYVIGETNLKLTNSMASRFVVNSDEGFNLTNAQILLRHSNTTGPVIFEIRVGENLNDAKITYIEERKSSTTEAAMMNITLKEQIFMPKGTTFWMVVHVPAGNLYPLGTGYELEKDLSNNCFYSSNMGQSWKKLEDTYYDNRLVWAMTPMENLKPVENYIDLSPNQGSVENGQSQEVEVNVDASQMVNGNYKANILINSNDKDQPILRIPYTLQVRGHKPVINLPEIIDFGSCLLGQSVTKTIELSNTGLGAVASAKYSFSNPCFKVSGYPPATIQAKSTLSVNVQFTPVKSGNENCVMTIKDANGNTFTTNLFVVTAEPPVIDITPKTISHSGLTIGDQQQGTFKLSNTGKYPLKYSFPAFSNSSFTETDKYLHIYGYQYDVTDTEDELEWVDISTTGTDHSQELKNMANTYVEVDLGFGFPFFGKQEQTGYITRYGVLTFDKNSTFNVQPLTFKDNESPDRFVSALGMRLEITPVSKIFSSRLSDRFIVQYQNCGISDIDFMTGEKFTMPLTFQIILFDNGDIEYKYKDVEQVDEYIREETVYIGIEDQTLEDGLCINDYYYQKLLIADNTKIHITNSGFGAVEILDNTSGTLMVGQSVDVSYNINTDKLSAGNFTEKVAVISNDPVNPTEYVNFQIEVQSGTASSIEIDKEELDFGKVFQGGKKTLGLKVANTGDGSIEISSISIGSSMFSTNTLDFPYELKYRHNLYLDVQINTENQGILDDVMTITYQGGNTAEIKLKGEITAAPAIKS